MIPKLFHQHTVNDPIPKKKKSLKRSRPSTKTTTLFTRSKSTSTSTETMITTTSTTRTRTMLVFLCLTLGLSSGMASASGLNETEAITETYDNFDDVAANNSSIVLQTTSTMSKFTDAEDQVQPQPQSTIRNETDDGTETLSPKEEESTVAESADGESTEPTITLEMLQAQAGTSRPGANSVCDAWRRWNRNKHTNSTTDDQVDQTDTTSPPSPRIRKDWLHMPWQERELYLDALELATSQGIYQRFLRYHLDKTSASLSHGTCAFSLWHRRYLLALENMLRSLGPPEFSCLTVPYWNIMEDYQYHLRTQAWQQQQLIPLAQDGACYAYQTCAPILAGLGGPRRGGPATRQVSGVVRPGTLITGRPFQHVVDDHGQPGIVRADLYRTPMPPDAATNAVLQQIARNPNYERYVQQMEEQIHDHVHNTVGGFMPTNASPVDFIFLSWHSTIDLFHITWEQCHVADDQVEPQQFAFSATPASCPRRDEGHQNFPNVTADERIYMRAGDMEVSEDPIIGQYFAHDDDDSMTYQAVSDARTLHPDDRFDYDMPPEFENFLVSDVACPNGTRTSTRVVENDNDKNNNNLDENDNDSNMISAARIARWKATPSDRSIEDWTYIARRKLDRRYPNDPAEAKRQINYFSCLVKTMGGGILNEEFLDKFLDETLVIDNDTCLATLTQAPTAAPVMISPAITQVTHSKNTWMAAVGSFVATTFLLVIGMCLYLYCSKKTTVPATTFGTRQSRPGTKQYEQVRQTNCDFMEENGNYDDEGDGDGADQEQRQQHEGSDEQEDLMAVDIEQGADDGSNFTID